LEKLNEFQQPNKFAERSKMKGAA